AGAAESATARPDSYPECAPASAAGTPSEGAATNPAWVVPLSTARTAPRRPCHPLGLHHHHASSLLLVCAPPHRFTVPRPIQGHDQRDHAVDLVAGMLLVRLDVVGGVRSDRQVVDLPPHHRVTAVPQQRTLGRALPE